ncbi:anaphase-promoting complex subunit 3 [Nematocida sp. LUAm3]|nr:anaphase-promoting complex subunit 3 [Nematocida sp. LUAm3]KAI5173584.1 anaphase-promoting complex subunit 3 [Nematocida sp. LUAm2]KAI5176805.1 anaphase-promoting complex subunit 3 [Nematocida sp. LUAm1]
MDYEGFLCQCIKYNSFDNAVYAVEAAYSKTKEHSLLLGYLFMRKKEYRRAIHYLSKVSSYSSTYYQAICLKNLKEYEKAKSLLMRIDRAEQEKVSSKLQELYILEANESFILSLLAELNILTGTHEAAIDNYFKCLSINPYIYTAQKALVDASLSGNQNQKIEEEENSNSFLEKMKREPEKVSFSAIKASLSSHILFLHNTPHFHRELLVVSQLLNAWNILERLSKGELEDIETQRNYKSLPLTSLSDIAAHVFDSGYHQKSISIFDHILISDPFCIDTMHYYSSVLWHRRDKSMLGTLARNLFGVNPFSNVSWAVLGNYFSLQKETDKAITCFDRSLTIKTDPYVLCLLGHEHFMNSNLRESLTCFITSIQMKSNSHSGIAGCGLIYERMGKNENAEYCFMRAIRHNPTNMLLGYLAVKFLVTHKKIDKAYVLLQNYLKINDSLIGISEKIEENSLNKLKIIQNSNEQLISLLDSFLLELSCILAYSQRHKAAESLFKELSGNSPFFLIRKAQVHGILHEHAVTPPSP